MCIVLGNVLLTFQSVPQHPVSPEKAESYVGFGFFKQFNYGNMYFMQKNEFFCGTLNPVYSCGVP
jgi:hypothetical protein